jgi:cation:H+ antiporter
MLIPVLQTIAGLLLLFFGGESLVRGAVAIAHKFGMSSLSIGLTIVAFATSAPELAVSMSAALDGAADIAIGNVVGSNIANIGLILALSALLHPLAVDKKIIRIDVPIMLVAVLIMCLFMVNDSVSRAEGLMLGTGLVVYLVFTLWHARRHPDPSQANTEVTGAPTTKPFSIQILFFMAGLLMLVGGGKILVTGVVTIATLMDISQAVIGLTVVAIGTSLPELATSLIAALKGYGGMAIGNIIGSNIFNIFGILGITAMTQPLQTGGIGWSDMGTLVLFSLVMAVFLYTKNLLDRKEGGVLLAGYLLYTGWLVIY